MISTRTIIFVAIVIFFSQNVARSQDNYVFGKKIKKIEWKGHLQKVVDRELIVGIELESNKESIKDSLVLMNISILNDFDALGWGRVELNDDRNMEEVANVIKI